MSLSWRRPIVSEGLSSAMSSETYSGEFVAKVVQGAQTGRVRTRVLVVGDRQIQLVYAASEAAYVEADAEGFFSSLVLTGK